MSYRIRFSSLLLVLACGGFSPAHPETSTAGVVFSGVALAGDKWIAAADDNICGIKDLKKVSNPAKVDYDGLWGSTPQIKKMKEKKIDPESTEGKALRSQAKTLITKSCELVRSAKGHCGVWKLIKNEDGRTVADVTDDVKSKFEE
jgi:hypothetical protein